MNQQEINNLFNNVTTNSDIFSNYSSCYLFTTENIKGYMCGLENKDVLTVCSSGEHYFNALLNGAKKVDLFDINKLALMILKLKTAAISNLDRELFIKYFGIVNKENVLDYNIYQLFSKYLDDETLKFFNYLYKLSEYNGNFLYFATSIFYKDQSEPYVYYRCSEYLEEDKYYRLQRILAARKFDSKFICSDINVLANKLSCKYDSIFLSNIQDYQDMKKYMKTIKRLISYLNNNGRLYYAYLYNNHISNYDKILNSSIENPNCFSISFPSVYADSCNENIKDKVYVYSKNL